MKKPDTDVKKITDFFRSRKEVSALYLFGSSVKGNRTDDSDIDIAVLIDDRRLKSRNYDNLKKEYYRASPTFSLRPVDIVILNTASPYLKHRILKTGEILFDRNRKLRVNFTTKAIIEYIDFRPIEEIFNKAVANRFRRSSVGR
ncbi:MAG: nucleotidyltransferase domain-containing protein [Nitrospiraceae bacterium]|nr:MAG: nucleotidyltransferase domain-containing protein [Nitrospiraceae bacterium]